MYARVLLFTLLLFVGGMANGQIISPSVAYTLPDGSTSDEPELTGSAPIEAVFTANPTDADGWTGYYEWRFYLNNDTTPRIIRYEENTTFTFREAGTWRIVAYARFTQGQQTLESGNDDEPFRVIVSESKLEFPNAFSPNGDGVNDIYRAKPTYRSIVDFHAYIFNRWGKKLFEWSDPAQGWDGKVHGHDVADGVYFLLCRARGADGRVFNIKKDVNILRGYTEGAEVPR